MDGYLAVVSKREVRDYADRPLPDNVLERILQAGRVTGSSQNRQPWEFYVVTDRARLDALSEAVFSPDNMRRCAAAVAIVVPSPNQAFDAGRVAQNMMVAAWALGVGSCPNGARDMARAREVLEVPGEQHIATILTLGYPRRPTAPERRGPDAYLERANRKPLSRLVHRR